MGLDQHSTINVWDWRRGRVLATTRGHSDRVRTSSLDNGNIVFNTLEKQTFQARRTRYKFVVADHFMESS